MVFVLGVFGCVSFLIWGGGGIINLFFIIIIFLLFVVVFCLCVCVCVCVCGFFSSFFYSVVGQHFVYCSYHDRPGRHIYRLIAQSDFYRFRKKGHLDISLCWFMLDPR